MSAILSIFIVDKLPVPREPRRKHHRSIEALRGENLKINILIAILLLAGPVSATVITVGPENSDYTTIQSAIYNASAGDVIVVNSGTYYENVYVLKNVTLVGVDNGDGMPVVDAGGSGSAMTLNVDGITLQGFNLTHSGHCGCGNSGIRIQSNNNTVVGNRAYKNRYGIYIQGTNGSKIYANDLVENNVSAYDNGHNQWYGDQADQGGMAFLSTLLGPKLTGNRYLDVGMPDDACQDSNGDGICDMPRNISGGSNVDKYPLSVWSAPARIEAVAHSG
jgi:parallel beta-helix repeat protein